jgi:retinol-binding protein 3
MRDIRDRDLSPRLRAAIQVLMEPPEPDASWRTSLLERIHDARRAKPDDVIPLHARRRAVRRWAMRPVTALAAGLACVIVGAATSAAVLRARVQRPDAPVSADALPVRFSFSAPGAAQVSLVGDFNRWDPVALPLRRAADGRTWEVEVRLPPGRYSYSFMVDGRLARDPAAPQDVADEYGSANSVLLLRGS